MIWTCWEFFIFMQYKSIKNCVSHFFYFLFMDCLITCFLWLLSINWFLICLCFLLFYWRCRLKNKGCVHKQTNWFVWHLLWPLLTFVIMSIIRELFFFKLYNIQPTYYPLHYIDPYNKSDFFSICPQTVTKTSSEALCITPKTQFCHTFGQYTSTIHLK